MQLPLDRYLAYADMTAIVQEWARQFPDRVRLASLGKSFEGRDIWCLTVTDFRAGEDSQKPAMWVDGNIHATEFCATSACLHFVERILKEDALLQSRAFYVVPRVCPDGAEKAFETPPRYLRSSSRPYPFEEPQIEGWDVADVDGDGRILTIRMEDPTGAWKVASDEPRLLVRRDPMDSEGPFYRVLPEGRLLQENWDGVTLKIAPPSEGLDLNRNFPWKWRGEGEQSGAGPYPASEPEVRACVEFLSKRPNVCHAVTFHTFSGVLLRPSSTDSDDNLPKEDLEVYKFFGEKGTALTGYPVLTVYHDFRYHPKEVITGTFDDWAYESLGVFAWTTEIWSAFRAAGLTEGFTSETARGNHRFIKWFDQHTHEEERQVLAWSDDSLQGKGYQSWRPFDHPQLGKVEIGGWDMFYCFRNPPFEYLERELVGLTEWLLWMAHTTPLLSLHSSSCAALGDGCYRLQMVLENRGWLPSYVTKKALERKIVRPLRVELELPEGARLVSGERRQELGQLEGMAYKPSSPFWHRNDSTDHRVKVVWVVQGASPFQARAVAEHARCGHVTCLFACA